eukprot:GILI01012451.1.p1 GENE.GILI01012451.1~~GILI01012451.1.p1  ORF type:complete len:234 (+),score=34.09 GILI01012451.1:79-780(+)
MPQAECPQPDPTNPLVFLDVSINGSNTGRIVIELFANVTPKTAENFRCLCTGEHAPKQINSKSSSMATADLAALTDSLGASYASTSSAPAFNVSTTSLNNMSASALTFKGSPFHRIVSGLMCQGGDITQGTGKGGRSVFSTIDNPHGYFDDENYKIKHFGPGTVAMAPHQEGMRNTSNSQFYITTTHTPWLDDKAVVVGVVTKGMEVVTKIEASGSETGGPKFYVKIENCGQL